MWFICFGLALIGLGRSPWLAVSVIVTSFPPKRAWWMKWLGLGPCWSDLCAMRRVPRARLMLYPRRGDICSYDDGLLLGWGISFFPGYTDSRWWIQGMFFLMTVWVSALFRPESWPYACLRSLEILSTIGFSMCLAPCRGQCLSGSMNHVWISFTPPPDIFGLCVRRLLLFSGQGLKILNFALF